MHDVVIRNGLVIDGTGQPGFPAEVALRGDRIADVGPDLGGAASVIDAAGLVVAPGFIDLHSHSDITLLVDPRPESHVAQGVTTEVSGNCGFSSAPRSAERDRKSSEKLAQKYGLDVRWETLGEFLERLERGGLVGNFLTYVGHGDVRELVVGSDNRPPTADELRAMRAAVAQALDEGAWGLSSGLIYEPGCFADTDELVALCQVVAERGGLYATHIRNEGEALLEAVDEALEIGRRSGAPVQISHHKATGPQNWGKVEQSLARLDEARAAGQDVACDQYPYLATSTSLKIVLPLWIREGGQEALLERLQDPALRPQLERDVLAQRPADEDWEQVLVAEIPVAQRPEWEGKSLLEIARLTDQRPVDALLELLIADRAETGMVHFSLCEEDVETVLRHEWTMIGSDASAKSTRGPLRRGKPHPRAFGTFPRVLGEYVRARGVLTLEQAVHKMTGQPAARLGLPQRGLLQPGSFADLVLFDPARIHDRATFADPHQLAAGVKAVFVNGVLAVDEGRWTGALAGRVLRRP